MIESGALIQTYVDTDIELQDAELLMPSNDQNLFEDDVDEEHVVYYETADELEEEFVEDDRISSNQQALQEVETELEAFENSRYEHVGRMPYRLLSISPEPIAEAEVNVPAPFFFVMPTQATVLLSTSAQDTVLPSTSAQVGPKKRGRPKGVRNKPKNPAQQST